METPSIFPAYTKIWHNKPYDTISPLRPELSARGKVVIITGGGIGMGASIAKAFAQAGARAIGIIGRREHLLKSNIVNIVALSTNNDIEVDYSVADVSKYDQINAAFKKLSTSLGKVDIFVSNAGFLPKPTPLRSADDREWWTTFETNVKGNFNAVRAFLNYANSQPTLISINSGIAHLPAMPGYSAYAASKIASARVAEFFQVENPELHAVIVQPGVTKTEMSIKSGWNALDWDHADLPGAFVVWLASPEAKFLKGKVCLGKLGCG